MRDIERLLHDSTEAMLALRTARMADGDARQQLTAAVLEGVREHELPENWVRVNYSAIRRHFRNQ